MFCTQFLHSLIHTIHSDFFTVCNNKNCKSERWNIDEASDNVTIRSVSRPGWPRRETRDPGTEHGNPASTMHTSLAFIPEPVSPKSRPVILSHHPVPLSEITLIVMVSFHSLDPISEIFFLAYFSKSYGMNLRHTSTKNVVCPLFVFNTPDVIASRSYFSPEFIVSGVVFRMGTIPVWARKRFYWVIWFFTVVKAIVCRRP